MSHFAKRFPQYTSTKLTFIAGVATLLAAAACAAHPAAPAAAPAAAGPESGPGLTEQQPPQSEDFVFVEKDHKEPTTHDDAQPATSLHADQTARKQRVAK